MRKCVLICTLYVENRGAPTISCDFNHALDQLISIPRAHSPCIVSSESVAGWP